MDVEKFDWPIPKDFPSKIFCLKDYRLTRSFNYLLHIDHYTINYTGSPLFGIKKVLNHWEYTVLKDGVLVNNICRQNFSIIYTRKPFLKVGIEQAFQLSTLAEKYLR